METRDIIMDIKLVGNKPVWVLFTAQDADTTRIVVGRSNICINGNNAALLFYQASTTAVCHRQTEPLERCV